VISDILFDAVEGIRRYQSAMPHFYGGMAADIEHVVKTMEALREWLDAPPAADRPAGPAFPVGPGVLYAEPEGPIRAFAVAVLNGDPVAVDAAQDALTAPGR
jgi:hypothetical protein